MSIFHSFWHVFCFVVFKEFLSEHVDVAYRFYIKAALPIIAGAIAGKLMSLYYSVIITLTKLTTAVLFGYSLFAMGARALTDFKIFGATFHLAIFMHPGLTTEQSKSFFFCSFFAHESKN